MCGELGLCPGRGKRKKEYGTCNHSGPGDTLLQSNRDGFCRQLRADLHFSTPAPDYNSHQFGVDSGLRSRVYSVCTMSGSLMQIGELAKRTTLSVDAIRFYEKRKLLPAPARTAGRFRLYAADDIERLNFVRDMHGLGFSLREIRELTDLRMHKVEACESVRDLLMGKLADVRRKLSELQKLESELAIDLKKCKNELRHRRQHPACPCPVLEAVKSK